MDDPLPLAQEPRPRLDFWRGSRARPPRGKVLGGPGEAAARYKVESAHGALLHPVSEGSDEKNTAHAYGAG